MASSPLWTRIRSHRTVARSTALRLLAFATWIPVIACFNLHVAELTLIEGGSMYPFMNQDRDSTLRRDMVLNYKWNPDRDLQRGMVVTLRSPLHPEIIAVKRIVALENQVISTKAPYPVGTVKVPPGHVWVEGDGPPGSSLDSNTYGPVSRSLLTGQVTHMLYPFKNFGRVNWREFKLRELERS